MSNTVKVTYIGGIDQVSVLFPSGDRRTVTQGETIEILTGDAANLNPDTWTPTTTPASEKK